MSFAYERGWRQGFAGAGFPGADKEFDLAKEYFAPVIDNKSDSVLVDMSCATGKFIWNYVPSLTIYTKNWHMAILQCKQRFYLLGKFTHFSLILSSFFLHSI